MKTITTSSQIYANYSSAASEILSMLEELGFTTDNPIDQKEIQERISGIILKNVSGNTVFNYED